MEKIQSTAVHFVIIQAISNHRLLLLVLLCKTKQQHRLTALRFLNQPMWKHRGEKVPRVNYWAHSRKFPLSLEMRWSHLGWWTAEIPLMILKLLWNTDKMIMSLNTYNSSTNATFLPRKMTLNIRGTRISRCLQIFWVQFLKTKLIMRVRRLD